MSGAGYYQDLRGLRKVRTSTFNRLRSLQHDCQFVSEFVEVFPKLPLVANMRCGHWYARDFYEFAYFKSTDGHTGKWDLNIRRLNLHLLPLIASHNGCIIVDSSRRKRMPDSFSRTIPVWAACINGAVRNYRLRNGVGDDGLQQWDTELHTPPAIVSRSEHAQMESILPKLIAKLEASGVDLEDMSRVLTKPLRPLWYTPSSALFIDDVPDFSGSPFFPVVLLNASVMCEVDGAEQRPGYFYIQGAADDEESWAQGLTRDMFWAHREELLSCDNDTELSELIKGLLADGGSLGKLQPHPGAQVGADGPAAHVGGLDVPHALGPEEKAARLLGLGASAIGDTGIVVCPCGAVADLVRSDLLGPLGGVIVCGPEDALSQRPEGINHHWLKTHGEKKDAHLFEKDLPTMLGIARKWRENSKPIVICCPSGTDMSAAVALAILLDADHGPYDKQVILKKFLMIAQFHKAANPSRANMLVVRKHFLTPDVYKK